MRTIPESNRLENFPITFFAAVVGLAGLTIAWENIRHTLEINLGIDALLVGITATVFVILAVLYAIKLALYRHEVIKELTISPVCSSPSCCSLSWAASPSSISFCLGGPTRSRWRPSRSPAC